MSSPDIAAMAAISAVMTDGPSEFRSLHGGHI
jgi:hypothetical protein